MVEVDKIENLKSAYPNYFFDVEDFLRRLKKLVSGEFQEKVPLSQSVQVDLSWLKDYKRR